MYCSQTLTGITPCTVHKLVGDRLLMPSHMFSPQPHTLQTSVTHALFKTTRVTDRSHTRSVQNYMGYWPQSHTLCSKLHGLLPAVTHALFKTTWVTDCSHTCSVQNYMGYWLQSHTLCSKLHGLLTAVTLCTTHSSKKASEGRRNWPITENKALDREDCFSLGNTSTSQGQRVPQRVGPWLEQKWREKRFHNWLVLPQRPYQSETKNDRYIESQEKVWCVIHCSTHVTLYAGGGGGGGEWNGKVLVVAHFQMSLLLSGILCLVKTRHIQWTTAYKIALKTHICSNPTSAS